MKRKFSIYQYNEVDGSAIISTEPTRYSPGSKFPFQNLLHLKEVVLSGAPRSQFRFFHYERK
jgi:hypothetical protein